MKNISAKKFLNWFKPMKEEEAKDAMNDYHKFEVDENIISDLIYKQNGTVATALRELIMNSIDAGSESVEITLTRVGFCVKDLGKGFESEEDILKNFKRFGQPHSEGDARYGRFRIGRGQVMGFAKTIWTSNDYRMEADVKNGLGFSLSKVKSPQKGCRVTGDFYDALSDFQFKDVLLELEKFVKYVPQRVCLNEKLISGQQVKWDYEDDDIKVRYDNKSRGIYLYSLGVLVKELRSYQYGFAAEVVTKKALTLNMARNEINENDSIWHKVHDVLTEELKRRQKGRKYTEQLRQAFIYSFQCDEVSFSEIMNEKVLKDARGKLTSISIELGKKRPWTFCEASSDSRSIAEYLASEGSAFVLLDSELEIWGCASIDEFLESLFEKVAIDADTMSLRTYRRQISETLIVDFQDLSAGVSDDYINVPQSELSPVERARRNTLNYVSGIIAKRMSKLYGETLKRKVVIGESKMAAAWTDSITFIAVRRDQLKLFDHVTGPTKLCNMLIHEYCHRNDSRSESEHDFSFYQRFHDTLLNGESVGSDVLGNAIESLKNSYRVELGKINHPEPDWLRDGPSPFIRFKLSTKKPNAPLLHLLGLLKLDHKTVKGGIEIYGARETFLELGQRFHRRLDSALKKAGIEYNFKGKPLERLAEFHSESDAKLLLRTQAIHTYFISNDAPISEKASKMLADFSSGYFLNNSRFGGLSGLAIDDSFGVSYIEGVKRSSGKVIAGPGFVFDTITRDRCDVWMKKVDTEGICSNKELRFDFFMETIHYMVKGITDPDEKKEFCERFLSEEFIKIVEGDGKRWR